MKTTKPCFSCFAGCLFLISLLSVHRSFCAPATLLFEDDFNRGIPGWTAVQPPGNYSAGPMRWQYDIVSGGFLEQSNIFTDQSGGAPSATAVMLINSAQVPNAFTYRARLTAGDNDGFGLIFGYQNTNNFYRVTFTREQRTMLAYPWNGWNVDRKVDGVATNLFGHGTPDFVESFVNSANQPFDVTVNVAANNVFNLTVIDDPEGSKIEYKLVESKPLPGPVGGRVGLVTWGMSGAAPPRGFRIGNLNLEPAPLAGNPNALTNWTPVVPPRTTGDNSMAGSGNGGQPIWSLALGQNGPYGTLHENSDAFGGNDPEGQLDFIAPSIVSGDVNWSNYMATARIIPADDDGHGLLVRYKDELNFYRIALRAQASGSGPRRGLSIQKTVNGVWEEIFHDEPVRYAPVSNVPYEISAVITANRLQVVVVADPSGAAERFSFGPFEITGNTVNNGKIGLFSWGMSRTEVDFVRVHAIDGLPLQVASPFGSPNPPEGLNSFPPGTNITASVQSPVEDLPGVRRFATGWTGLGSVPATGTSTAVSFTLNDLSEINWNWRTDLRFSAKADAGGTVVAPTEEWLPEGANIVITARPNAGFLFTGWAGDIASAEPTLNLTMTRPLAITAAFEADSDNDRLPDSWEEKNFGNLSALTEGDPDQDGRTNLEEYQRGSDPGSAEALAVSDGLSSRWENVQRDPILPGQMVIRDFGAGFRGVWENSNDFREATDTNFIGAANIVENVSFEGPRIIIRTNVWNPSWSNYTAQAIFSVGDNDGNCLYFRYQNESNWYRVTVVGDRAPATWRAPFGVSIQKRVNGQFTELGRDESFATDPADIAFYKRIRVTVRAEGSQFEARVIGWNAQTTPADWLASSEVVLAFTDDQLPNGRVGVGTWGQSGGGPATPTNPVNAGALIEDVVVTISGQEVFREDWDQTPLFDQFPAGWSNPLTGTAAGNWRVSAHGTLMQLSNFGPNTTALTESPKADADGPIFLAPAPGSANFLLEIGFQPFDNDGIGFVYDYKDTNNYSRVLFASEPSGNSRVPQGLSVSRKSDGVWSDIFAGDLAFIYKPGTPFGVEFSSNSGEFRLLARDLDDPTRAAAWSWTAISANGTNRFGLACWGETDAHFLYARAFSLQGGIAQELRISRVSISGGNLVLTISNPSGSPYTVEKSETLTPGSWTVVASDQTEAQWTNPVQSGVRALFYRLRQVR